MEPRGGRTPCGFRSIPALMLVSRSLGGTYGRIGFPSELPMPEEARHMLCVASWTPEAGSAVVMNTLLDFGAAMQVAGEMPPFNAAHPEPCLAHRGSKEWAFS